MAHGPLVLFAKCKYLNFYNAKANIIASVFMMMMMVVMMMVTTTTTTMMTIPIYMYLNIICLYICIIKNDLRNLKGFIFLFIAVNITRPENFNTDIDHRCLVQVVDPAMVSTADNPINAVSYITKESMKF